MKYLFMDNFRGFRKAYLPIKDVNFFVGENSTGKTSVLSLLKLLSTDHFFFGPDYFNSDEIHFGHFDDIVSVNSTDRSYFCVGLIESWTDKATKSKQSKDQFGASLLTFVKRAGVPTIARYYSAADGKELCIDFTANIVKYKFRKISRYKSYLDFRRKVFEPWLHISKRDKKGYVEYPKDSSGLHSRRLLPILLGIQRLLTDKKSNTDAFSLVLPSISSDVAWLAPIRTHPKRTYDEYKLEFSPEGMHTPYLIKKILERKTEAVKFKRFIERVGRASGLFETVKIKKYGKGPTAPFELDVVLNRKALSVNNVGYGVSQSLPVIVETFARSKNRWIAIQQPEVHLHPRAQSALGDVFYGVSTYEKKKFLIETHIDFLIDSFRLNYRKSKKLKNPDAQVLFFERTGNGNIVHSLPISSDGTLPRNQPNSYREFFIKQQLEMVGH